MGEKKTKIINFPVKLIGDIVESEKFCKDILYHQTDRLIFKFFPVMYYFGIHDNSGH